MELKKLRRTIQNIAVLLLIFIGAKNIIRILPFRFFIPLKKFYNVVLSHNYIVTHYTLSFITGALMLLLAYQLYKRVRTAWIIEVICLTVSITTKLFYFRQIYLIPFSMEIFVLIILLITYKDFSRISDPITFNRALLLSLTSLALVLCNASIGLFIAKKTFVSIHNIYDAILSSIKLLIFMDKGVLTIAGKTGDIYADTLIMINWTCISLSALFILKPLIYNPISHKIDIQRTHKFVAKYGQNSISYLALEDDKKSFFGEQSFGVCSYTLVGNAFVVCGDMICDEENAFLFLNEILAFCRQNDYQVLFLNITDFYLELYKKAGFEIIKYGEDACFELVNYNLAGGKVAKVRAAINHANKEGIIVKEYKPLHDRNMHIEKQFDEISHEWLNSKGGKEMKFMVGGTNLHNPMERRYFYAVDKDNKILGFAVFLPYLSSKGYLADVTRRRNNSPQGVIEKIIFEAFMTMKDEGALWGNMGLSPLYNANSENSTFTSKVFNYIYENMNKVYDFKALHHSKEKFAPTVWQPRYLAYSHGSFYPNLAYAIVRVQMGKSLTKVVFEEFKKPKAYKQIN